MKVIDNPAHLRKRCPYLYQGKQLWGGPFSLPERVSNAAGGASSGLFFPNARGRSPVTSSKSSNPVLRCRLFLLRSSSGWRQQQVPPCERGKCKGRRKGEFLPPTDRWFFLSPTRPWLRKPQQISPARPVVRLCIMTGPLGW